MRDRYHSLVTAIATGAMLACGDAAVGDITAPPFAATPATPVANTWPTVEEITNAGIPNALGIQITLSPRFEYDYQSFVVEARVRFQWANDVSANVKAWLINRQGATINSASAGMSYKRIAVPVASGDTTFTVRISTNGFTCDLTGKSSAEGSARVNAIDAKLIQIVLWEVGALPTNGPDVLQPACEEDPPAPPSGGGETVEVCYTVWREYWVYDYFTRRSYLVGAVPIGTYCETVTM